MHTINPDTAIRIVESIQSDRRREAEAARRARPERPPRRRSKS